MYTAYTQITAGFHDDSIRVHFHEMNRFVQAMAKYRTLHSEYKRVQRDYESLQLIIRCSHAYDRSMRFP